jgi:hypothetical protein
MGGLRVGACIHTCTDVHIRAAIQRRGSILAWIVILSVYGADTIAEVKLLIPPLLRYEIKINYWVFKQL